MNLSPIQQQIVNTKGNLVVRASAGTGKTHTMVAKIAKEVKQNRTHKVIAAITFTIKAAQEIKDRLTVDILRHFIGTNNSFAIEEVIKPFMKDVYGAEYDIDMSTDYAERVLTFQEGVDKIRYNGILCSYKDNRKNFIFDLAQQVVEQSKACRLYLQAKYFKIYIDEYQDCDQAMHRFFMFLCDVLGIETFIVGDEKQSIYIWRGAYPEAFKSLWEKPNFKRIFMGDNFRSCQQIQNYSNLLCEETRSLYSSTKSKGNIIWLTPSESNWAVEVLQYINPKQRTALLRFKNADAETGANELTQGGISFTFIPQLPIADITTDSAWLYLAIAKCFVLEKYSVYDLISEIPAEGAANHRTVRKIEGLLNRIQVSVKNDMAFELAVENLANYLGYETRKEHIQKLHSTIMNRRYYPAFNPDHFQDIAITFHSSKGLEFDQVILFAEDYSLNDMSSIYNHYVAITRAKHKVVIVKLNKYYANCFQYNLARIFAQSQLQIGDLVSFK